MTLAAVGEVELPGLRLFRRGKVRDTFELDDRLLMVSTDRVSAFDCVLPTLIPDKGRVLTALSKFWFAKTAGLVPNHLLATQAGVPEALADRSMLVRRAERIDIECVVRQRLAGSGWSEYRERGTLAGEPLPVGLDFGDALPELRFTPATKNDAGHDVNITRRQLADQLGEELAERLEALSLRIFAAAAERLGQVGLVLADTKFEFGWIDGQLHLIDELLTPDSSRLWEADNAGSSPVGLDKQLIRDHLLESGWDRHPPAPALPSRLVEEVRRRYLEVCLRVTGLAL